MQHCVFLAYSVGDSSVSQFFSKLAEQLSQRYRVVVFSDKRNELPFTSEAVTVVYWPSPRPTRWKDFTFLRTQIQEHKPKLMLSTFGANNLFMVAGYLSGVPHRIPTHRTISSHFKTSKLKIWRKRLVFKLATLIISNSKATKEDVIVTFGVKSTKVKVVYNAVAHVTISSERDPNLLVYVGRLTANKGIDVLLQAFQQLRDKKPELKLIVLGGSDKDVAYYKNEMDLLKLSSKVEFLGSQPKQVVLETFAKASFAVVPSLTEGFGFVVIEAFSVGTPVIGSDTGGIKEIIRQGTDGFLFEPGSATDLSKAIVEMHGDAERRIEMGNKAHQRFLDTFELNTVVQELATYLSDKITTKA